MPAKTADYNNLKGAKLETRKLKFRKLQQKYFTKLSELPVLDLSGDVAWYFCCIALSWSLWLGKTLQWSFYILKSKTKQFVYKDVSLFALTVLITTHLQASDARTLPYNKSTCHVYLSCRYKAQETQPIRSPIVMRDLSFPTSCPASYHYFAHSFTTHMVVQFYCFSVRLSFSVQTFAFLQQR